MTHAPPESFTLTRAPGRRLQDDIQVLEWIFATCHPDVNTRREMVAHVLNHHGFPAAVTQMLPRLSAQLQQDVGALALAGTATVADTNGAGETPTPPPEATAANLPAQAVSQGAPASTVIPEVQQSNLDPEAFDDPSEESAFVDPDALPADYVGFTDFLKEKGLDDLSPRDASRLARRFLMYCKQRGLNPERRKVRRLAHYPLPLLEQWAEETDDLSIMRAELL
ncbi:MAG: hypothetical protein ACFCBW_07800 [Candidatus Competibacterales bacterium]